MPPYWVPTPSVFSIGKPTCLLQGMMRTCEQSLSKEGEATPWEGQEQLSALGVEG